MDEFEQRATRMHQEMLKESRLSQAAADRLARAFDAHRKALAAHASVVAGHRAVQAARSPRGMLWTPSATLAFYAGLVTGALLAAAACAR